MARRLALFISRYNIDNSPSILNVIELFAQSSRVTLFLRRVPLQSSPVLTLANVEIVNLDRDRHVLRQAAREQLRRIGGDGYDAAIGFDPQGLVLAMAVLPHLRPVYYSLELYVRDDHFGLNYPWWVRFLERGRINAIAGLIIQSPEKEEIFRRDYRLSPDIPALILPVTYRGPSSPRKSDLLRNKLGIAPGVKILLHLGGIAEYFSCIELARTVAGLEGWALVFHGYGARGYVAELEEFLRAHTIGNVFIHDEQYRDLEMIDEVVKSGDVGVAWYNDISVGFRTAGRSSGKIPAYMRFGLPVLAKRYRSTVEAIEAVGAGVCVDDFPEVPAALQRLSHGYEAFSACAREEYDRHYRFERYVPALEQFVWSAGRRCSHEPL